MYTDDLLQKLHENFNGTLETIGNGRKLIRHFLESGSGEAAEEGEPG
jgi:hypothetical protein